MKKKILSILISVFAICTFMFTLSACEGGEPPHTHVYDQQVVNDTFKASNATCEDKATYFYSCSCGEGGLETFEVGEALGHAYSNWASNGNNTHSKTCANDNTHIITEDCSGGTPTETQRPVCKDCHTEYGESLGHVHTLNLTKVEAKPQSCTKEGNIEYYTCSCGKWFTDDTATTEIKDKTSVVIAKDSHKHSILKYNKTEHWYECSCGDKATAVGHIPGAEATETTDQKCIVCEHVITPALGHVHTLHLTKVDAKPQSCTKEGNKEYYTCSCGKWFTDDTATTEIKDKTSVVIAKDSHKHSILKYNKTEHWYECSCGDKATAVGHIPGAEATETTDQKCTVCEHVITPALGHVHTLHLTKVDAKPQSCTKEGNKEYYTCSCGKWFADNTATTEITDKASLVIEKDDHNYETLKKTATEHWYECSCGDRTGIENHKGGTATCQVKATCSVCGEKYETLGSHQPKTEWVTTETHHYHECKTSGCTEKLNYGEHNFDSNKKCSGCDYVTTALLGTEISSNVYEISGTNLFVKVPNAQTNFSFAKTINVAKGATYKVYTDISCKEEYCIPSYVVNDLKEENNVYYFLVSNGDEIPQVYTITVRRRPKYTVTFNTDGGSYVAPQTIEEDALATKPNNPTKTGYDFVSWDYDFNTAITGNKTIKANWAESTKTPYRVEYYLENLKNDNYSILSSATENLTGTTNSTVYADIKTFEHFTAEKTSVSGVIAANGTTVLKVYYQRDEYTVTFDGNGGTLISGEEVQTVKYGGSVIVPIYEKKGYTFKWDNIFTAIEENIEATAKWELVVYNIDYVLEQGTLPDNRKKYTIEDEFELNIPKEELYYNFSWELNGENISAIKAGTSGNIIIYGKWQQENKVLSIQGNQITNVSEYGRTLKEIDLNDCFQDEITQISSSAFNDCICLEKIIARSSVEHIGSSAFSGCSSLTSVVIPDSVTTIGEEAFLNCRSLTKVNYLGTIDSWAQIEFGDIFSSPIYYAGNLYINDVLQAEITINAAKINSYAFYKCNSLTKVTIGNSTISIGSSVFRGCDSLTSVLIGNSVTSIGKWAFEGCSSLTSIEIPNSVTSIGDNAFYGCYNLQYNIEGDFAYLGNRDNKYIFLAKAISEKIIEANINSNCIVIDSDVFYNCTSLTSIEIPDSVTSIGKWAFYNCTSLTSVEIPDSVTSIGDYTFYGCTSLASVVIGDSVTSIGKWAFYGCKSLTSVVIGDSVTSIGDYAFHHCTPLTSIEIPDSVISIGEWAFCGCDSLTSVKIPDSVISMGDEVFYGCDLLTILCEVKNRPSGWSYDWRILGYDEYFRDIYVPVIWDCDNNDV